MNHYEELGIATTATAEQVRDAYRAIAKLLHPDQQRDDDLRRMADIQMKRLNAIYAVLSDPERRRRYDTELARAGQPRLPVVVAQPPVEPERRETRGRWGSLVWLVAAVLGIVGLGMYLAPQNGSASRIDTERVPEMPAVLANPAAAESHPAEGDQGTDAIPANGPASMPASGPKRQPVWNNAKANLGAPVSALPARGPVPAASLREPPSPEGDRGHLPGTTAARISPPSAAEVDARPSGEPAERVSSRFAGTWFFTPARSSGSPGLYPPEFIETTISEDDGTIRGRYRARYQVADKPISPDVVFYFEGAARNSNANLRWSAGNGARGEVRLKLLSENSMEVSWAASELGRGQGLASGTAVLVRRRDP